MIKIKDVVKTPLGHHGDVQALRKGNAIHPDGLALVRLMGSQDHKWFNIRHLRPVADWAKKTFSHQKKLEIKFDFRHKLEYLIAC